MTKTVNLKINNKNISYYKELGYDVQNNIFCEIKIEDLSKSSHYIVTAKCDICGIEKDVMFKEYNRNIKNYNIFSCCNKCANIKNKKTSLEKYGVEHFSKTKDFVEKMKKSNIEKYGEEFYTQTEEYKKFMLEYKKNCDYDELRNKSKATILKKYGVDNYYESEKYKIEKINIIEKYKNTITKKLLKKYENLISTDNKTYVFLCKNGHEFKISRELLKNRIKINTEICTICNCVGSSKSGYENLLYDFIKYNYKKDILKNNRTILNNKYELDIYLPELKIAFEFNGLYWHNEINKENDYHLNKTENCEKNGIQLIHIWEDDWNYRQDIVKSILLNKLGKSDKIYARKTELKEITDNNIIRDFLEKNHIQGFVGSKIKLGLYYNDELVSLMTFGDRRISMGKKSTNDNEYELLRFCNKLNTNVIGGASKLFKYFLNKYNPSEITTYADRSFSQGGLYKKIGFVFVENTKPNYYYIIDGIRKHRFNLRKDVLLKQGFDKNKTEHEIMLDRKIYRIYDSGNLKFIYKKS